jgi:hypothetical protein
MGFFIVSCEVVSTKTVKLPNSSDKLVITGLVSNLGIKVYVSKTTPVLETNVVSSILDAEVVLLKNSVPLFLLQKKNDLYSFDSLLNYNQEFKINIKHLKLGEASATLESLPSKVSISQAYAIYNKDKKEADISITFSDLPIENYYAYKAIPSIDGKPLFNESIYKVPYSSLLNDVSFKNQVKTVKTHLFLLEENLNNKVVKANQVKIILYHLSKSTYEYYRSLNEYDLYHDDTFAEVSGVRNNINNGYGFIGFCNIDTIDVHIK